MDIETLALLVVVLLVAGALGASRRTRAAVLRWLARCPGACLLVLALSLTGCTKAQGLAAIEVVTRLGCELVAVLAHDEQVGTLCSDLAPRVEEEIARMAVVHRDLKPANLMGHRHRRRHRPVRVAEHVPGRDPRDGETIEPEYLDAVRRALAKQAP